MKYAQILIAFTSGYYAGKEGKDFQKALEEMDAKLPKRKREWVVKPCKEYPEGVRPKQKN